MLLPTKRRSTRVVRASKNLSARTTKKSAHHCEYHNFIVKSYENEQFNTWLPYGQVLGFMGVHSSSIKYSQILGDRCQLRSIAHSKWGYSPNFRITTVVNSERKKRKRKKTHKDKYFDLHIIFHAADLV